MKYASIYIKFNADIRNGLQTLINMSLISLQCAETCRVVMINGIGDTPLGSVLCVNGESDSLKIVYRTLSRYFRSEEAVRLFLECDDEELLEACVYDRSGNP